MNKRNFRYWSVVGFLGLAVLFVLVRYAYLAASPPEPSAASTDASERGTIADRNGRILAMDSPLFNIAVWRPETRPGAFPAEAARLASITGVAESDIMDRWSKGPRTSSTSSSAQAPRPPGRSRRPRTPAPSPASSSRRSRAGSTPRAGSPLTSSASSATAIRDWPGSRSVPTTSSSCSGRSLTLTIDADIQYSLEEIARKAMTTTGAQAVIILAADARTGEILSYVAMPDFDPNDYASSPPDDWYDWPSVFHYEPGSVFKVFTMASVLDLGGADAKTTFYCDGAYHNVAPSGEKITIKCLGVHGTVNIQKILELSCNAGAAYATDTVGAVDFYDKLRGFGFGSRTGLVVPSETPGLLRSPETWSLRSKPTIGMGQEVFVSAVQMVAAATAIANGGVLLKPYVVAKAQERDGSVAYANEAQPVRRAVSAETAASILAAMETVSSEGGTGKRAKVADIRMAVKTGTAK